MTSEQDKATSGPERVPRVSFRDDVFLCILPYFRTHVRMRTIRLLVPIHCCFRPALFTSHGATAIQLQVIQGDPCP